MAPNTHWKKKNGFRLKVTGNDIHLSFKRIHG